MKSKDGGASFSGIGGFTAMLFGAFFMVLLVVSFNHKTAEKEIEVKQRTRIVKINNRPAQVARETPPKSAPKPRKATAKAPSPNLDALIGGIAMNVPEFAAVNVKGDANELLDDLVEELVMSEQTVDSKPKVTSRPPMSYPVSAVRDGLKGFVVVNLLIARDGSVELAKIVESQPRGVFDNTVLSGVHDWVFIPARYKGQPVKVWARQRVSFSG